MTRDDLVNELLATQADQKATSATSQLVDDIIAETKEETGFTRWAQYSAASSFMGLAQIAEDLGLSVDLDEEEALLYRDLAEVAAEDNPVAGIAGALVGSTVDLAGGSIAGGAIRALGKITGALGAQGWNNLFTQGLTGGAIGGFLEPILTEEDSTLTNVGLGTAFGGVLGGAAQVASRLFRGPEITPSVTPETGPLALPAPAQPVALLPSPEVATPRIPFMAGTEGKPPTAGGVVRAPQEDTGLAPIQGYPQGTPAAPGVLAPRGQGTYIRPSDSTPADSFNALAIVRSDLQKLIENPPSNKAVRKAEVEIKRISDRIERRQQALAKARRGSPARAIRKELDALKAELKTHKDVIFKRDVVKQAQLELVRLDNGQVSPVVLDRIANIAKKKPIAKAVEETQPKEPRRSAKAAATKEEKELGTKPTATEASTAGQDYKFFEKPEVEPTPPPNVRVAEEILGRRAEDKGDAGAAKVDIGTAGVDTEAVQGIPRASTQRKEAQGFVPGQGGREFTEADLRRRKMYQNAEEVGRTHFFQPEDLLDKPYNFKNAEEAATVLQDDINQAITEGNFKDAGDWLVKTFESRDTKTLTPVERLVATRIFAIASSNLNKSMTILRKRALSERDYNDAEMVRIMDDIQTTEKLATLMRTLERIDEADRRNISNSLKNFKLANKIQKRHQRQLAENQMISDLFFGVMCGKNR